LRVKINGPQSINGNIQAPSSKAYTHRALLASLLSQGETIIQRPLVCEDTQKTLRAIQTLGAHVRTEKETLVIRGVEKISAQSETSIDCGESGTTFRLLAALGATSTSGVRLRASRSLAGRPQTPLLKSLEELGGSTVSNPILQESELYVQGPLKGGETWIDGNVSSQFISGLLFASPCAENDVTIHVTHGLESKPYVKMSLRILERHGIKIEQNDSTYHIPAPQVYRPTRHQVPGDYSSAAFLIAGAATAGDKITIEGLNRDHDEPDAVITKLVEEMGVDLHWNGDSLTVRKNKLQGFKFDARDNPDLVPPLQVLGSLAEGDSEIQGVRRLRYKETDRLETLPSELRKMGAKMTVHDNMIKIEGGHRSVGAGLTSHGDHRVAMACSIASLAAKGDSVLEDAETVSKSYPEFYTDLSRLGAQLDVE
jgi:3-phosphoshikimate 1-carboxyvinyltransferase